MITINGISKTLANPGGKGAVSGGGNTIGSIATTAFLEDATIWEIKIYDQTGVETLIHSFAGNPAGNTDAAWDDTVGTLTAYVAGSPATRDLNVSAIETPPGDDTQDAFQSAVTYDQINRDFAVNPIKAFHLKIITTSDRRIFNSKWF